MKNKTKDNEYLNNKTKDIINKLEQTKINNPQKYILNQKSNINSYINLL